METAFRTPWVEIFRREGADHEVRLQAAQGLLAPRPAEQLALLVQLTSDGDGSIAAAAEATLSRIPRTRLEGLLARPDAPSDILAFFEARGVRPATTADSDAESPLVDEGPEPARVIEDDEEVPVVASEVPRHEGRASAVQVIAQLGIPQRLALAMKGTRAERAILIRDPNKIISLAVLSSPRLTETEVESFARMASVSEEVPRTIAGARGWVKNYAICVALVKNSKTPLAISMNLLSRLNDKDLRSVSIDRNVPEVLRSSARRKVVQEKRY
jgi:hypothetical protein